MNELNRLRSAVRQAAPPPPALTSEEWSRLSDDPRARIPRPRAPLVLWAVAAAIVVLAGVGIKTWPSRAVTTSATEIWIDAQGTPVERSLADGTTIALDPGASGRVSEARDDFVRFDLRRGRARFDVTRNSRRSFHVAVSGYDVRVLGTRFDVELLAAGQQVSVAVERGSVSVTPPGTAVAIVLGAGDRFESGAAPNEVRRAGAAQSESEGVVPSSETGKYLPQTTSAEGAPVPKATTRTVGNLAVTAANEWWDLQQKGQYAAALAAARKAGFDRLTQALSADKLAALADAARLSGDSRSAIIALSALEKRFPDTVEAEQAAFLLGRVRAGTGDTRSATESFEHYLVRYPAGTYATEAMGRLAELYGKRRDQPRARRMAERYLQRAPSGPYARLARSLTSSP